jgi:alcohol dehydrogenase class IV
VSRRASWFTDALALPAFDTLFHELPGAIEPAGRDLAVLERLQLAASAANVACGNAGLGLVHGLNKGITYIFHSRHYPSVPYGLLHAILLPWVMEFNVPAAPERSARLAEVMGVQRAGRSDEAVAQAGTQCLREWLRQLGAPQRLPWERCTEDDVRDILDETLGRPMARDNPRPSTAGDLARIVERCLEGWE